MPRIRTIKPEHWNDRALTDVSLQAQLLWIGMWNFSDDMGVIDADPVYIKSMVFPRRDNIRVQEVSQWLGQLVKARFLVPFEYEGESYYVSRTFDAHQKIDRPQPSKIPETFIRRIIDECSTNDRPCRVKESRGKVAKATSPGKIPGELDFGLDEEYAKLLKNKAEISNFIKKNHPMFPEPYVDLWNIFASEYDHPVVRSLTYNRRKKFKKRVRERDFDFLAILKLAKDSEFIQNSTTKWFSFDWIIESEGNYMKVLEGNFSPKKKPVEASNPMTETIKRANERLKAKGKI